MIRLAADEDFNRLIVHGVRRRQPTIDLVRVQDRGLAGADDPTVLEWAASEGRVLLSHDSSTMRDHAYARIRESRPMPGLFIVRQRLPIGLAVEEVVVLAECSFEGDWEGQVRRLPL